MRVVGLLVLALVAGLMSLPLATAQFQSQVVLRTGTLDAPLTREAPVAAVTGQLTYTGDVGSYQSIVGIPVQYVVTEKPDWAVVIVSPATDIIPVPSTPGLTYSATRSFQVVVAATPNATGELTGTVQVTAVAAGRTAGAASSGSTIFAVDLKVEEPCEDKTLSAQSAAVTPLVSAPPELAALAGVAVALALRRRR